MPELPPALEKKIGPFPVVAWLGIIGGGVALGLVLRKHGAGGRGRNEPDLPELEPGATTAPVNPATGQPILRQPVSGPPAGGTAQPVTPTASPPATNAEWSKRAVDILIANGVDPVVATQAIGRYLDGSTLDYAQQQALSIALRQLGSPPEYVPAPQTEPSGTLPGGRPPADAPEPTAPGPSGVGTRYIVRPDDGDIAQFVTDYQTIEWIPDSYKVKALAAGGAISAGTDGAGWPIPLTITRGTVAALRKVGSAPIYPANYSGPRTAW